MGSISSIPLLHAVVLSSHAVCSQSGCYELSGIIAFDKKRLTVFFNTRGFYFRWESGYWLKMCLGIDRLLKKHEYCNCNESRSVMYSNAAFLTIGRSGCLL